MDLDRFPPPPPPRRPVIRHTFSGLNVIPEEIPRDPEAFTLTAPPRTDLWRKPPGRDTSTAPILFTALRFPFVSAEVTVVANWKLEWDQAGLVIFAGPPAGPLVQPPDLDLTALPSNYIVVPPPEHLLRPTLEPPSYVDSNGDVSSSPETRWVKLSLEFLSNSLFVSSTHATGTGADWSRSALPSYHAQGSHLRLKFERLGHALWLYYEDQFMGWTKIREITGFFFGVNDKQVRIGVYASRPASFASNPTPLTGRAELLDENLCVEFEDLAIF
jgi:regulation of enolase protein 1 (concanavalin A-like superfamily)